MQEEDAGRLVYNQPAGHLEQDEDLLQAARRETLEETGWEVELSGLLSISLYTAPANGITYHRTCFAAQPVKHHPAQALDPDIHAVVWMTLEDMKKHAGQMRSPLVIPAVERYLTRPHYPLAIFHAAGEL